MGNHKIFHNDRHYLAYIFLGKVLKQKFSSNVLRNLQPVSVAVAVTAALPASPPSLLMHLNMLRRGGSSPRRIFPGNGEAVQRQQKHNLCGSALLTSSDCWFARLAPCLLCYFIICRNCLGAVQSFSAQN